MNNFDGYYESESTTNARAWRIALESVGYFPNLNTEAEAGALANLVDVAKASDQNDHGTFVLRTPDAWDNPASELDDTAMFSEYYGDSESVREDEDEPVYVHEETEPDGCGNDDLYDWARGR